MFPCRVELKWPWRRLRQGCLPDHGYRSDSLVTSEQASAVRPGSAHFQLLPPEQAQLLRPGVKRSNGQSLWVPLPSGHLSPEPTGLASQSACSKALGQVRTGKRALLLWPKHLAFSDSSKEPNRAYGTSRRGKQAGLQVKVRAGSRTRVPSLGIEPENPSSPEAVAIPEQFLQGAYFPRVVLGPHSKVSSPCPEDPKCPNWR